MPPIQKNSQHNQKTHNDEMNCLDLQQWTEGSICYVTSHSTMTEFRYNAVIYKELMQGAFLPLLPYMRQGGQFRPFMKGQRSEETVPVIWTAEWFAAKCTLGSADPPI